MTPSKDGQLHFNELEEKSKAEIFDEDNPSIWNQFNYMALNLIVKGVKHYGAKAIFEIIRYHRTAETNDSKFKLNNNYTSYYARKFIRNHPEHKDFFETRKSKGN